MKKHLCNWLSQLKLMELATTLLLHIIMCSISTICWFIEQWRSVWGCSSPRIDHTWLQIYMYHRSWTPFYLCAAAATSKLVESLSIPFVFKVQQQMVSMLTFVAISCKFAHIRLNNTFIRHWFWCIFAGVYWCNLGINKYSDIVSK